jgi:hypothetical protein
MRHLRASPPRYIKFLDNGCAYKVKTIMATTKITHFTSISAVDQGVLLLWLVDVTMCKMTSMNLVEAYGVASDVLQL